jgi:hypothetical protein
MTPEKRMKIGGGKRGGIVMVMSSLVNLTGVSFA